MWCDYVILSTPTQLNSTLNSTLLLNTQHSPTQLLQVWTNTCCSHPLTGMEPSEIDTPADVAAGTVPGVKNAAIRKLQHELGLTFNDKNDDASSQFDSSPKFTFLTRLRYWACDTVTHGAFTAPWGEHEIDYVLFLTVPHKEDLNAGSDTSTAGGAVLQPHPDEVDDVRWVNPTELTAMLNDDTILFSPWFRLICHKWLLPLWWKDLEGCLTTQKYCDYDTIHEFDPPTEHYGGAGNAGPLFGGSNGGSDGASASAVASGASGASGEISAMGGDSRYVTSRNV
jgi:isopentenyl-diphosphate delta-isomerase type 1